MDDMQACEAMVPLILRHADATLADADRARLELHAASCEACRDAIADQAQAVRLLSELPMIDAPRDFAARVRDRVAPRGTLLDVFNWRAWTLRLAPVAALLALLAWLPSATAPASSTGTTSVTEIDTWTTGGADTTTALLVSAETEAADLLASAYAGYAR